VSRWGWLAGAAALAAAIVVAAVLISAGGADDDDDRAPAQVARIAQDGVFLGDPDAPATLIEFADLQCPFCAEFAGDELPGLVDSYVRDGRLRLELRLLAFIGPDSVRARQVAHAAALQDRMWAFTDRFFRNQGAENSGYATNAFLQRIAQRTPGLDVDRLTADFGSREAEALTREAERLGRRLRVEGTPAFYLVRDGGEPEPIEIQDLGEALEGGSASRKRASPKLTRSPGATSASPSRRTPFTRVPLREPRSRRSQRGPSRRSAAWRRETLGSSRMQSQSRERPSVTSRPLSGSARAGT
jgi:protein-disulfide isomerase